MCVCPHTTVVTVSSTVDSAARQRAIELSTSTNSAAHPHRPLAERREQVQRRYRQRPGREITGQHDEVGRAYVGFGQYRLQRRQHSVDVGEQGDPIDHPATLPRARDFAILLVNRLIGASFAFLQNSPLISV